jgi:DNA repair exonuclease SbcCD ATPase subunit
MSDFFEKFRKTMEESLETAKQNAQHLKEIAEDYGKVARLKFEIFQLQSSKKKKMELLGETVFPFIFEKRITDLKNHETLQVIIDNITRLDKEIEMTQKSLAEMKKQAKGKSKKQPMSKSELNQQIQEVEKEIESRINDLQAVKAALKKDTGKPAGKKKNASGK